jgi:uncharacterized protein
MEQTNQNMLPVGQKIEEKKCCEGDSKVRIGILFPIIIGLSLILSATVVSFVIYQIKAMDNTLQVTGSAKKVVSADVVKWNGEFIRNVKVDTLKGGYVQIASDLEKVKAFLKDAGISEDIIEISPVYMYEQYNYKSDGSSEKNYNLTQTIQIQSEDVEKITSLAKNVQKLIEAGVIFSTRSLEYYYTKLPEVRVELLSEAVKDARNRAEKIAQSNNDEVGVLKSASVGVVQVLPVNSTEISDYGAYDTSSIEKEVMITVRTVFQMK